MEREIKFRAWNKYDNEIQTVRCVDFKGDGTIDSIRTVRVYIISDNGDYDFDFPLYKPEDIILQQYTGLKDKNGEKENFQSDLIKDERTGIVFEIVWNEEYAGWWCISNDKTIEQPLNEINKYCVNIGNIYEGLIQ